MIRVIHGVWRWTVLALLLSAGAAAAASDGEQACQRLGLVVCPEPEDSALPAAGEMLRWSQAERVVGFRNGWRLYPGDVIRPGRGPVKPLAPSTASLAALRYSSDGHAWSLEDYLRRQSVTGLLILKQGRIVAEYYGQGNSAQTLWTSRSVAKSLVSVLVGMAIKERRIDSLEAPIDRLLPELVGSAWQGVTLRQMLQHSSGIAWNEDYADPKSDFARLTACEAGSRPYDCVLALVRSRPRRPGVAPGQTWSYNTGGAWLVGLALERATGMTIAAYLETRLWQRYAMQDAAVWQALLPGRTDMGGHGFNATLRDWGRFGLFVAGGGRLDDGTALLPEDWLAQSVTWSRAEGSVTAATPEGQYGFQWWYNGVDPAHPGALSANQVARQSFWAEGIYGQALAINPGQQLVMVQWSTWPQAEPPESMYEEQALFFAAVAQALAGPAP